MIDGVVAARKAANYLKSYSNLYDLVSLGNLCFKNSHWEVDVQSNQESLGTIFVTPDGAINRVWSTNPIDIYRKLTGTY